MRVGFKSLAWGILVAAMGCSVEPVQTGPVPPVPTPVPDCWYVSPAFTPLEHAWLVRASVAWVELGAPAVCLTDTLPARGRIDRIAWGGEEWTRLSDEHGHEIYGATWADRVAIVDALGAPLFEAVAVHEFGHVLGLGHAQPPAIMAAGAGSSYSLTDNDRAECVRVAACPL